jgi:hypothetical protein
MGTLFPIGVYGYSISFAGTLVFCVAAVILHVTKFKAQNQKTLLLFALDSPEGLAPLQRLMEQYCVESGLKTVCLDRNKNEIKYEYFVVMQKAAEQDKFLLDMSRVNGVTQLKINHTGIGNS